MHLDRVLSLVQSPTSCVMRTGHSNSQVPSQPLGMVPVMVQWPTFLMVAQEVAPQQAGLEVYSRSNSCSLEPAALALH